MYAFSSIPDFSHIIVGDQSITLRNTESAAIFCKERSVGEPRINTNWNIEATDHVGPSFEQIEIEEAWARAGAAKRRRFAEEQREVAASTFDYCSSHSDEYCEIEYIHSSYLIGKQGGPFFARFGCECAPFVHASDREGALMCYYGANALEVFATVVADEIPALVSALDVYYLKNGHRTMPNYFVGAAAAEVLAFIGMPAVPALTEKIECGHDRFARAGAAKALKLMKVYTDM